MDVSGIEIFVKVVNTGSFSAAARALGVSKSHTSKRVSQLEDRLGARLLQRTTRKLILTDVGRSFYDRCSQILADLSEAEAVVAEQSGAPRGRLRMAVPMTFGIRYVAPLVAEYAARYPDVLVDVQLSDARVDLLDGDFDLAVRVGALNDSSMVARKLAPVQVQICASPGYLRSRGVPETPRDLRSHDCLVYTNSSPPGAWHLGQGEEAQIVHVAGRLRSNNAETLLEAARRDQGVVMLPDFVAAEHIRAGALVSVLQDWRPPPIAAWIMFPHKRHLAPKVRSFVDFVAEKWRQPPWSCEGAADVAR